MTRSSLIAIGILCTGLVLDGAATTASAGAASLRTHGRATIIVNWDGTGDYPTIQQGLDATTNGDTVTVMPSSGAPGGAYIENITFPAGTVTLRSTDPDDPAVVAATVIDGNAAGSVVTFATGAPAGAILEGFTIQNGQAQSGAAIACPSAGPTIRKCVITNNHAAAAGNQVVGGTILGTNSSATISRCVIRENSIDASSEGFGHIAFWGGAPVIEDCLIAENTTTATETAYAGGIYLYDCTAAVTGCTIAGNRCVAGHYAQGGGIGLSGDTAPRIANCTIADNTLSALLTLGGGLRCVNMSKPTLAQCTFSGNTADEGSAIWCYGQGTTIDLQNCVLWGNGTPTWQSVSLDQDAAAKVAYTDIQWGMGGLALGTGASVAWLNGNIDADPLFADPSGPDGNPGTWQDNDYHLQPGSPCISAGDPAFAPLPDETDIDGQPRLQGCRVDMGSDETTLGQAGDLNNDGNVNCADHLLFEACTAGPNANLLDDPCTCADLDTDNDVDLADFAIFQTLFTN